MKNEPDSEITKFPKKKKIEARGSIRGLPTLHTLLVIYFSRIVQSCRKHLHKK